MLNIDGTIAEKKDYGMPLFRLGFRPFFLGAGLFSIVAMLTWMASYVFAVDFAFSGLPPNLWHAHEMLFGYTMAVVAGFLLTAVKNWTGIEVLRGKLLAALFLLWLAARILPLTALNLPVVVLASFDVAFILLLTIACLRPVIMVRQYKQVGIISKLLLLMLSDIVFYLGISGSLAEGVQWGMYSAVYLIISLILMMMRRVMPMFIQNGVDGDVTVINRAWLDRSSLVLLLCLWLLDVFTDYTGLTSLVAAVLVLLHSMRLAGWFTGRIWHKPLLWILVIAYAAIILGFALKAAEPYFAISSFLSLHAFTVGGIGLVTIGMMSRVSLGHTGRDVFAPPAIVFWILLAVTMAAIVRVILPLFNTSLYTYWIGFSQVLWVLAFVVFVWIYAPMFLSARVDGRDG